jgi:4-diphosphocytidyl-2-C-methyl-D-erythritol kinase
MKLDRSVNTAGKLQGWRCETPAKINLFLEVLGKRPDGYHDLDTVMLAIDLTDTLEIYPAQEGRLTLDLDLSEAQQVQNLALAQIDTTWKIPTQGVGTDSNLVLRALDALRSRLDSLQPAALNSQRTGAHVILKKRIPAQAGLGGGSSNAAAALVLGSLLWQVPYDPSLLGSIASELGSDINFFLEGYNGTSWTARCTQRGQIVQPIANQCEIHGLIVHPPAGCSTAQVFSLVRESIAQREQAVDPGELIECLSQSPKAFDQPARLGQLLYNRLDAAAAACTKWVEQSARRIDRFDPLGQCLSGSGSARFCLLADRSQAQVLATELGLEGNFRAYPFSGWTSPSIGQQITAIRRF